MSSRDDLGVAMDSLRRFSEWGRSDCAALWLDRSWDQEKGGFVEALDMTGAPMAGLPRRFRVQARQIFVLGALTRAGWGDYTAQAVEAMAWLKPRAFMADGQPGWVHKLGDQGEILDAKRDLYDHAFILLALATLHSITGDADYIALADETLAFLDTDMVSADGGYIESIGGAQLPRRQNPHMHLFEALIALYDATGREDYLIRLKSLFDLFENVFYDAENGVVREFFAADWSRLSGREGLVCEPGHACEWVWLLAQYDRITGADTQAIAQRLYSVAMETGINSQTGLLFTSMGADGEVYDAGSRSWMQTEWVRAGLIMASRGEGSADAALDRCIRSSFEHHFLDEPAGGWMDQVDAEGEDACDNMPTSTLYHVVGALLETERSLELC